MTFHLIWHGDMLLLFIAPRNSFVEGEIPSQDLFDFIYLYRLRFHHMSCLILFILDRVRFHHKSCLIVFHLDRVRFHHTSFSLFFSLYSGTVSVVVDVIILNRVLHNGFICSSYIHTRLADILKVFFDKGHIECRGFFFHHFPQGRCSTEKYLDLSSVLITYGSKYLVKKRRGNIKYTLYLHNGIYVVFT